jgi:hypothetical protein
MRRQDMISLFPVLYTVDCVVGMPKRSGEPIRQHRIVFDYEHAHTVDMDAAKRRI